MKFIEPKNKNAEKVDWNYRSIKKFKRPAQRLRIVDKMIGLTGIF